MKIDKPYLIQNIVAGIISVAIITAISEFAKSSFSEEKFTCPIELLKYDSGIEEFMDLKEDSVFTNALMLEQAIDQYTCTRINLSKDFGGNVEPLNASIKNYKDVIAIYSSLKDENFKLGAEILALSERISILYSNYAFLLQENKKNQVGNNDNSIEEIVDEISYYSNKLDALKSEYDNKGDLYDKSILRLEYKISVIQNIIEGKE